MYGNYDELKLTVIIFSGKFFKRNQGKTMELASLLGLSLYKIAFLTLHVATELTKEKKYIILFLG